MARTVKARTFSYENITVGLEDTTRERTILGAVYPAQATWGNTENIAIGVDYGADENLVVVATNLLGRERLTP